MGLRIMTQQKAAEGPEPLGQPHTCLFLLAWHIGRLPHTLLKSAQAQQISSHLFDVLITSASRTMLTWLQGFADVAFCHLHSHSLSCQATVVLFGTWDSVLTA